MRRARTRAITGSMAAFLLAAAIPPAEAGRVEQAGDRTIIHVKLFDLPDPTRTDAATRADAAAVREFIRRFPSLFAEKYREKYRADPARYGNFNWDHVEIRLERFSGIQVEGVESDLLAIAGGMAPDVLYVNFRKSDTYIQQGFLYPLDKPEDGYLASLGAEELALRVHEKIWPVILRRGPGGAKRVWALPYGGALGRVLLYRKDLFDEAGLPYPTKDWTWEDMIHAARALTHPEVGRYGLAMGRGKHESWYWVTFLWSAGGEVMTYDEERDAWDIRFDSPAGVQALDYYTRLGAEPWTDAAGRRRRGYVYKDPRDSFRKWERGEIGMVFAYVDEKLFSSINPDLTGMAPVPLGPGGGRGAELNSRMMGLFSGIENPAVRDAAWEYIRFFDSPDALAIKTRVLVEGGLGRFVNPRYLVMFGFGDLARLSPPGWAETFRIAIETGRPEPYGRHSNIAYNLMTQPIQEAEQRAMNGDLPDDPAARARELAGLLGKAAGQARSEMLDVVPPARRALQRWTAAAALALIGVGFAAVFRRIIRTFTPAATDGASIRPAWAFRRYAPAYLMLLPAVAAILVWRYAPLARGAVMAFQDYRLLGDSAWVGLDNFGKVLWSSDWWFSLWNAFRYSALVMALTFLPPVILAILLQEVPRGKILFRMIYYLPAVMTGIVVVLLWKSFYEPGERGVLNTLLMHVPAAVFLAIGAVLLLAAISFARRLRFHGRPGIALLFLATGLGLLWLCARLAWPMLRETDLPVWRRLLLTWFEPHRWLGDPRTAMPACVLPMLWAGLGPGCLIYLAALKSIPDELYEAAELDGATFTDKVLFVVFPMLKPLLVINFVGVFIGAWYGSADTILAMTGGASGTEVAGLHIFFKAFIFLQFGPATAMAWMLGLLLIGFTVCQLRILSRIEFRAAGATETAP